MKHAAVVPGRGSGACIGEGARERLSKHEPISTTGQSLIAVTQPNNPSSS